jgi:hypothetical protein
MRNASLRRAFVQCATLLRTRHPTAAQSGLLRAVGELCALAAAELCTLCSCDVPRHAALQSIMQQLICQPVYPARCSDALRASAPHLPVAAEPDDLSPRTPANTQRERIEGAPCRIDDARR